MDNRERSEGIELKSLLVKLSPRDKIYNELETNKAIDNVIGFIPASDCSDSSILLVNLAVAIAQRGFNTCILDAKVFYPNIYKLLDCEANEAGKGLIRICRSDKVDLRDVINETKYKNLYLLSPSPSDPMEDYFDFQMDDVDRVIAALKDTFDFVLIDIPNIPPLEFCVSSLKNCNVGFFIWGERIDCPQNTSRLLEFIGSLGIGVSKLMNVILNNLYGIKYDKSIIEDMKMKLIAEFPFVSGAIDLSLEGRVYIADSLIINKKYKESMNSLVNLLTKH